MPVSNMNAPLRKNVILRDIIFENIKHWYVIAIALIVTVFATVIYTLAFITPLYKSTAKLYITDKTSEKMELADLNVSYYLAQDIPEIICDTPILQKVSDDLGNKYSAGMLKSCISVKKFETTRILEVIASTNDPATSKAIADSVCKISEVELAEILGEDRVKIIREGNLPSEPYSPNLFSNVVVSVMVMFSIVEIIIILNYTFNNKISSAEDVEKYLGLTTLASIPYNKMKTKN